MSTAVRAQSHTAPWWKTRVRTQVSHLPMLPRCPKPFSHSSLVSEFPFMGLSQGGPTSVRILPVSPLLLHDQTSQTLVA